MVIERNRLNRQTPLILIPLLIGLPVLGVFVAGLPVSRYFEFPPDSIFIHHRPFSWMAFGGLSAFVLSVAVPLFAPLMKKNSRQKRAPARRCKFPAWGWIALFFLFGGWVLAWTRFPWFKIFQPHTFGMVWFPFIAVINAITYKRKGSCILLERPSQFAALFPLSAIFWWFFEYLNRFVQNWHYVNVQFGPLEYFIYATISFSTVLPAVLSMTELVLTFSRINCTYKEFYLFKALNSKFLAWTVFLGSCLCLFGIGIWPSLLFPLLWLAPLLLITSLQALRGVPHVFSGLTHGDWTRVISGALAALICGWFWEMWNYWSLAKWEYFIPFVGRFHLFEMPILGYAGYLPFGLECMAIVDVLYSGWYPRDRIPA